MASGHVNRTNRPNTWLHRPTCVREENPCQLGAVHTWHDPDVPMRIANVGSLRRSGPEVSMLGGTADWDDADLLRGLCQPPYSTTRSARASTVSGIPMLSAFAVRKLIDNSTCVGCSTGRSAGFTPAKIFFT